VARATARAVATGAEATEEVTAAVTAAVATAARMALTVAGWPVILCVKGIQVGAAPLSRVRVRVAHAHIHHVTNAPRHTGHRDSFPNAESTGVCTIGIV